MPELPDIVVYLECLRPRVEGQRLERIHVRNPFSECAPPSTPISELNGKAVNGLRRVGKRIVFAFENDLFLILHLMIAGRLQWKPTGAKPPGKIGLAAFEFTVGYLDPDRGRNQEIPPRCTWFAARGGPGESTILAELGGARSNRGRAFARSSNRENHTPKRSLTDPGLFSGIGNSYSDEILHRARLSPLALTQHRLTAEEIKRLFQRPFAKSSRSGPSVCAAKQATGFPRKVTAFREEMAVHGRFGLPGPVCGTPVQRIVYAENETNYCPRCQTGGKVLADRALSRLLHDDWPKSIDESLRRTARPRNIEVMHSHLHFLIFYWRNSKRRTGSTQNRKTRG